MKIIALVTVLVGITVWPQSGWAIEIKNRGINVTQSEISADSLLQQADASFKNRDDESALKQYNEALNLARKEFNKSVEVEALSQIARVYIHMDQMDKGRDFLQEAERIATDSDPMGWSRYLSVKGRYQWKDKDLNVAGQTFETLYSYCDTNALWGRAVDAANMMAIVSDTPEKQIEWSRRGIEAAEANENESWLGPLWNNLAGTYYDMKEFDSSLACYLRAREYHWRFSDEIAKLYADYHVGMAYRMTGNFKEAGKWLRPVLAWAQRIENHSVIGQALQDLSEIEIAGGNKSEGVGMLKKALQEYRLAGFDKTWPEILDNVNKRIKELGE